MFKRLLPTLVILAVVGVVSAIAQMGTFAPNMPIIGGSSYCSSTVNAVCVNTVPAGPAVSGAEYVPADTGLTQGTQPQSGKINIMTLGAGVLTYNVPLTGDSITLTNATRQLIVEPAGTIAALTVVFPAATTLLNGQKLGICTTQIVTALTLTAGSGTTISGGPTAMLVPVTTGGASCPEWTYRTANTTWYRVH